MKSISNQVIGVLKGNWSLRRRQRLPLHSTTHPSSSLRASLQLWYTLHSFILWPKEEKILRRALMIPFLAIHAKGGESMSPKQKDRTTTKFQKHQISKIKVFKLISYCVQKGEKVGSSKLAKPSWTLRGEFYLGGVLFKSKEKHLKQGEKISNLKNALQNLIHLPWLFAKELWKEFTKEFAKTKHVVQTWSKILYKKETFHAYLVSSFIGSSSKQPLHLHYAN